MNYEDEKRFKELWAFTWFITLILMCWVCWTGWHQYDYHNLRDRVVKLQTELHVLKGGLDAQ
jgi:hypothetical protein